MQRTHQPSRKHHVHQIGDAQRKMMRDSTCCNLVWKRTKFTYKRKRMNQQTTRRRFQLAGATRPHGMQGGVCARLIQVETLHIANMIGTTTCWLQRCAQNVGFVKTFQLAGAKGPHGMQGGGCARVIRILMQHIAKQIGTTTCLQQRCAQNVDVVKMNPHQRQCLFRRSNPTQVTSTSYPYHGTTPALRVMVTSLKHSRAKTSPNNFAPRVSKRPCFLLMYPLDVWCRSNCQGLNAVSS